MSSASTIAAQVYWSTLLIFVIFFDPSLMWFSLVFISVIHCHFIFSAGADGFSSHFGFFGNRKFHVNCMFQSDASSGFSTL